MALDIRVAIAKLEELARVNPHCRVLIEVLPDQRQVLSPPRSAAQTTGASAETAIASPEPVVTVTRGGKTSRQTSPDRSAASSSTQQWKHTYKVPHDAFGVLKPADRGPISEGDSIRREAREYEAQHSPRRLGGQASPTRRDGRASVTGNVPVYRYDPASFGALASPARLESVRHRVLTSPLPPADAPPPPQFRDISPQREIDPRPQPAAHAAAPTWGRLESPPRRGGGGAALYAVEASAPPSAYFNSAYGRGQHDEVPLHRGGNALQSVASPARSSSRGPSRQRPRSVTPNRTASAARGNATPRGKRRYDHVHSTITRAQSPGRNYPAAAVAHRSTPFFGLSGAAPGSDVASTSPRRRGAKGVAWVVSA